MSVFFGTKPPRGFLGPPLPEWEYVWRDMGFLLDFREGSNALGASGNGPDPTDQIQGLVGARTASGTGSTPFWDGCELGMSLNMLNTNNGSSGASYVTFTDPMSKIRTSATGGVTFGVVCVNKTTGTFATPNRTLFGAGSNFVNYNQTTATVSTFFWQNGFAFCQGTEDASETVGNSRPYALLCTHLGSGSGLGRVYGNGKLLAENTSFGVLQTGVRDLILGNSGKEDQSWNGQYNVFFISSRFWDHGEAIKWTHDPLAFLAGDMNGLTVQEILACLEPTSLVFTVPSITDDKQHCLEPVNFQLTPEDLTTQKLYCLEPTQLRFVLPSPFTAAIVRSSLLADLRIRAAIQGASACLVPVAGGNVLILAPASAKTKLEQAFGGTVTFISPVDADF